MTLPVLLESINELIHRCHRPDILLSRPEGKELKRKAWDEAIEQAKKLDPNFQAPAPAA